MSAKANDTYANMLKEQFIPDPVFVYVSGGGMRFFDGSKSDTLWAGECGIARRNSLLKFELLEHEEKFEPVVFCFDEPFLQAYLKKHPMNVTASGTGDAFLKISNTKWIDSFIRSLQPYARGVMQLDEAFEELKYEELLTILLRNQPELARLLFHFGAPQKINLEAYMNQHFTFNISLRRFAYLTGRSLSVFKRDFKAIFNDTPSRWLVKKRLQEAYFLMNTKKQKPSDIYLALGFESLSHFSVAFKRQFGLTPGSLTN